MGAYELAEHRVRERQLEPHAVTSDPAPAPREVPHQELKPVLDARAAADRELDRARLTAVEGPAREVPADLRPARGLLEEAAVEHRQTGRREQTPVDRLGAGHQVVDRRAA